jgi:hypothetical protein
MFPLFQQRNRQKHAKIYKTEQTPSDNRSLLPKTAAFETPQLRTFNSLPPPNERFQSNWRLENFTKITQADKNIIHERKIKIFSLYAFYTISHTCNVNNRQGGAYVYFFKLQILY